MRIDLKRGSAISQIHWQAWPNGYQRLLVQAPITGFLALEARWNDTQLLVIDYTERQRILTANTAQARQALLQLDVPPAQWYLLFTGRISQAAFTRQQGRQKANTVTLSQPASQGLPQAPTQRITLDDRGLPVRWVRFPPPPSALPAQSMLRVEYQHYYSHAMSQQISLFLPRQVRVFVGTRQKPTMVLALRRFSPTTPHPTPFFRVPTNAQNFTTVQP